jgi:hypothetical protein
MITFDWIVTLCNRSTDYNMRRTKLSCRMLTEKLGASFLKVTPGIRPKGASQDDQHRITTFSVNIRLSRGEQTTPSKPAAFANLA